MSCGAKHKQDTNNQPLSGLADPPPTKRVKTSLEFTADDEKRKLRRRYDGEDIQLTTWERAMIEQFPDVLRNGVLGICLLIVAMRREPAGTILSVHNIKPKGYKCIHDYPSENDNCESDNCFGFQPLDVVPHSKGLYFRNHQHYELKYV
jgi:hypothetical protein